MQMTLPQGNDESMTHHHQLCRTVAVGGGASSLLLCSLHTTTPSAPPHALLDLVAMVHRPHFGSTMQHSGECDVTQRAVRRDKAGTAMQQSRQHDAI